jgi:ABC-type Fe3+-siderophore transport system permease subunit
VRRIRELLLTQYIGAIVIGLVISQAITNFVSAIVVPAGWYLEERSAYRNVLGSRSPEPFNWYRFLISLITVALYILIAYLLLRWLYLESGEKNRIQNDEITAGA